MRLRRLLWQAAGTVVRKGPWRRRRRWAPGPYSRIALRVTQADGRLLIRMATGPGLEISGLVGRSSDGARHHLAGVASRGFTAGGFSGLTYDATVDLNAIADIAAAGPAPEPDGDTGPAPEPDGDGEQADAAGPGREPDDAASPIVVSIEAVVTSDQRRVPRYAKACDRAGTAADGDDTGVSYWAPLGRFRRTELTRLHPTTVSGGPLLVPQITRRGHLQVAVGAASHPWALVRTTSMTTSDGMLRLAGNFDTGIDSVTKVTLLLRGRDAAVSESFPASVHLDGAASATAGRFGRQRYHFTATADLSTLIDPDRQLSPHTAIDPWLEITVAGHDDPAVYRVGRVPLEQRAAIEETTASAGDYVVEVVPYFTFKSRNVSLLLEQHSAETYRAIVRSASVGQRADRTVRNRTAARRAPVWIIGERPHTAQDNGYHLFRYLRTERRDIDAYYVITADSPDRKNLEGLDHVVDFGSARHVHLAVAAERIIGTHHPDYLFPSRSAAMNKAITARRVFLQHGVMGTKWMVPNYGKFGTGFDADLVCVSSQRESDYLVHDFEYSPDQVAVTGLARFDALLADDVERIPGQVLVLPTWRDWLTSDEAFEASEYLQQWLGLLEHPRLQRICESTGATVTFYLHNNMQRYAHHFRRTGIDVIEPGERDLQELMKQSSVMVTDYSSPAFDFSFLGRPVVYFQFDGARFFGKAGSHLDVDAELPGVIAHTQEGVLTRLAEVLQPGFEVEASYRERAARFLTHPDRRNCERITRAIEAPLARPPVATRVRQTEVARRVQQRARRSRFYFPVMRRAFRLFKRLPIDTDTIVFESGVGRQFGDSPRAIYEELVRRRDPRRRVWVYHKTPPVSDPRLVVVKRFSPRYFYFLARAKYWVNNQNFPYYITRRPDGVYLQTWHGTPLKRMLFDLDRVVGRDDGYLGRVAQAVAQWTDLVSPSPYATRAFRSAFRYTKRVRETGYPRNDVLCAAATDAATGEATDAARRRARRHLGVETSRRVLLYAPTFRDDQKVGKRFELDMPIDLERFAAEFGADTMLLLRMHPLVANKLQIPAAARDCVRDVSATSDIAELYLAADCLVTDYSSVLFDFALTGKPMVFYPYDLDRYRDEVRGFYLDYDAEMPGPIAKTEDELFAALHAVATDATDPGRVDQFAARFAPFDDGHAAARVVDAVFGAEGPTR